MICDTFDTQLCREILLSDSYIELFMLGKWSDADGGKYIRFYPKDGSTWSQYALPNPDVDHDYYNIKNLEYIFTDENHNLVAKVYKFEFVDANTVKVYAYEDGQTYTLKRK